MDNKDIYIASESTFYRIMRLTGQNTHGDSTRKPRASNKPYEKEKHPYRWVKGRLGDWSPITKMTLNEMLEKEKTTGVA